MNSKIVLGVDIGGTHITTALVDIERGKLVSGTLIRRLVSSDRTASSIIAAWCEVIKESFRDYEHVSKKIGIAMPGPFDYEQGISRMENQGKFKALYGLNIREMISERLPIDGNCIRFANDAGSFICGEVVGGIAKGYDKAVGITLGTGLGAATYCKGKGEDAGLWSAPFREGIAEDYFSTSWFVNRYKTLTGIEVAGVKDIIENQHDANLVKSIFEEFGKNLGEFLAPFLRDEQPQILVLGGNISNAMQLFYASFNVLLETHQVKILIAKTVLGEVATLIGAASIWKNVVTISSDN